MASEDLFGRAIKLTAAEQAAVGGSGQWCLKKEALVIGKKDQTEQRNLLLSTSRCLVLATRPNGRVEVSLQFHFLRLERISSPQSDQLLLHLAGETQARKFQLADNDIIEFSAALVSQERNTLPAAPKEQLTQLQIEPANRMQRVEGLLKRLQESMQPTEMTTCGGFVTAYSFLADHLNCPFKEEVAWDIANIYATHGFRQLSLTDFRYLEGHDLLPIIAALKYGSYFEGLSDKEYKLSSELIDMIGQVLGGNISIKQLTLDGIGLKSEQVIKLSQGLSLNKKSVLVHLDLSNNHLDDKGFESLAQALEGLPHGLVSLLLSNTGMSSRAASLLSGAMTKNSHYSSSLDKLDWSGNSLGTDSQASLLFLLDTNSVSDLRLSNCQLHLDTVLTTLRRGCCQHLSYLDLSNNMRPAKKKEVAVSPKTMKEFFSKAISLETVSFSGCKLPADGIVALLGGIASNPNIIKVTLDISTNEIGVGAAGVMKELATVLSSLTSLVSLDISDSGLDNHLEGVLPALLSNKAIKHLAIGKNFKSKNSVVVLKTLVKLINAEGACVESLSIADSKLKDQLGVLLGGLLSNHCITKLDISGNDMGDQGARQLAKMLLINSKLHTVLWDHNATTLAGFEYVANALQHNCTMRSMPIPFSDVIARGARDHQIEGVIQQIERLLIRNHSSERAMVELASRRNKVAHMISSHQQELDRALVQLEDLMAVISSEDDPAMKQAAVVKEEAYKVSQLAISLYPPKVETEQANQITEQLEAIATPLQTKFYEDHVSGSSERMVSLCEKTCPTIFAVDQAKERLLNLLDSSAGDHASLTRPLVTLAGQEMTSNVSSINLEQSSKVCQLVFNEVTTAVEECVEQLVPLKPASVEATDAPKPKPRPQSYKSPHQIDKKPKRQGKTVVSKLATSSVSPEPLPDLTTDAPIENVAITKNRAPRPNKTHRATRPSLCVTSISTDYIDTPLKDPSPSPSPLTSPVPTPSPAESPFHKPTKNAARGSIGADYVIIKKEELEVENGIEQVLDYQEEKRDGTEAKKEPEPEAVAEEEPATKPEKKKDIKDKKEEKKKEKEDKKQLKEGKKKEKLKEKEEKKQQKGVKKVKGGKDIDGEMPSEEDKVLSMESQKSVEVEQEFVASVDDATKKANVPPPPTKPRPKKSPPEASPIKKPILPPNPGAAASLASVLNKGVKLVDGDKKVPPVAARRSTKVDGMKKPDGQDASDVAVDKESTNKPSSDEQAASEQAEVTDGPEVTEKPVAIEDAEATEKPEEPVAEEPVAEEPVVVAEQLEATEKPEVVKDAGAVEEIETIKKPEIESKATEMPEIVESPPVTKKLEATEMPEVTEKPDATEKLEVTEKPDATEKPDVTEKPGATEKSEVTEKPGATEKPEVTENEITEKPKENENLEDSKNLDEAEKPEVTDNPVAAKKIESTEKPELNEEDPVVTKTEETATKPETTEKPEKPGVADRPSLSKKPAVAAKKFEITKKPEMPKVTDKPEENTEVTDESKAVEKPKKPPGVAEKPKVASRIKRPSSANNKTTDAGDAPANTKDKLDDNEAPSTSSTANDKPVETTDQPDGDNEPQPDPASHEDRESSLGPIATVIDDETSSL